MMRWIALVDDARATHVSYRRVTNLTTALKYGVRSVEVFGGTLRARVARPLVEGR
jgi:hypothetical protein